jgi:primosomal replication protein N
VNQVILTACIAEVSSLRYTPAGLPALDFQLDHESEVSEAGQQRQVRAVVKSRAFGSVAESIVKQAVGSRWRFTGFLATPRNGKHPVLHVQQFQQD